MKVCRLCGREGSRGFEEEEAGTFVCGGASAGACATRQEEARLRVGLHRIEYTDRNGQPSHYYKLDGKRAPGVTTIIKRGVPAPRLIDWAARVTARYAADNLDTLWGMRHLGADKIFAVLESEPRAVRDSAGARGTQLHKWAEDMIHGKGIKAEPELLPWVIAVRDFIEDFRPEPVLMEAAVGSRRWGGYAGTLDLVADFPEVRLSNGAVYPAARRLIDYKSSRGIYGEIALQLGAYRNAEFYSDGNGGEEHPLSELGIAETGFAVHIRPEGYRVLPVYCGEEALNAFARVKWLGDFLKQNGELDSWLGDPLPVGPREGAGQ